MNWEELTAPEFERAVERCGRVCLLPLGIIEKHGDHLPLGTDMIIAHRISTLAARAETAMVFPPFFLGNILEAKHVPGTIALRAELQVPVLENICDEIGRNGFEKIIIVNGHGGNKALLGFFLTSLLDKDKPYQVVVSSCDLKDAATDRLRKAKVDGHGGEHETMLVQALSPRLVKTARYGSYGLALNRIKQYTDAGLEAGIWWYADFPGHFAGEKVPFSRAKGKAFVRAYVAHVVRQIKLIKKDTLLTSLQKEYRLRTLRPANRYP